MKINVYPSSSFYTAVTSVLILFVFANQTIAQRFNSVVFNKLPQDYQLYPRDTQNEGKVPFSGIVEITGYSYVSVQVFRNDVFVKYLKAAITYDSKGLGTFATETKIKAELAQYSFKVFVCKTTDSTLIINRQNVVSGDVYVVDGQSNSTGFFAEKETNPYCRTFGKITDVLNTANYNPADTLWALSNQETYLTGVGAMGFEIQKQLSQKYGIPNCLINGGFHWSSSVNHAQRTENNPADLTNGYGRMLYRIQKAGLAQAVKSFIYRQGESEAYHEGSDWAGNFKKIHSNLKLDFPNLEKIYVFQIDIIYFPSPTGAELREYQRRLPELYPNVRSLATVGTKQFDGLHYGPEGYKQNGQEISRLIAKDFYHLTDTLNINSPSVKKAFYASEERKQLILVFDEGQQMVFPEAYKFNNQVTLSMKDFFYLNGFAGSVNSGKADENKIILDLNSSQTATRLDYLPPYVVESNFFYPYNGPFLTNKLGMRAFTFNNVIITNALKSPILTSSVDPYANALISWNEVQNASAYILERKLPAAKEYSKVAVFTSAVKNFEDKTSAFPGKISYRVKAVSENSESAQYAYSEVEIPVVLGLEAEGNNEFSVFPNPAISGQNITLQFKQPIQGTLTFLNSLGQKIATQPIKRQTETTIPLPRVPSAYYFIQLKSENKILTKKLLIQ